jgi:hypothetical protein
MGEVMKLFSFVLMSASGPSTGSHQKMASYPRVRKSVSNEEAGKSVGTTLFKGNPRLDGMHSSSIELYHSECICDL